jgi:phosphoglycolate phosphatase-like HAD superfamily hydrolase
MSTGSPRLVLFDLDGTLTGQYETDPLPGVERTLVELAEAGARLVGATNQGGVGYRYAYERWGRANAAKYPTVEEIVERLKVLGERLPQLEAFYVSLHSGQENFPVPRDWRDRPVREERAGDLVVRLGWLAEWRKPAPGMLLQAIEGAGADRADALMVGDRDDDRLAAAAARVRFEWAEGYFA